MPLAGPPEVSLNPLQVIRDDLRAERRAAVPYPPGERNFSMRRTQRIIHDPIPLLLEAYERYGPVFTLRIFHSSEIFMLGPAANHFILVSGFKNFRWREGHFRDLIPFLGDGLLTIDGDFHDRSRQIMMPAFHHLKVAAQIGVMLEEIDAALDAWRPGDRLDLYAWTRRVALRVAMRAVFGLDPDGEAVRRIDAARLFADGLEFHSKDALLRVLRGPFTPYAKTQRARRILDRMIYGEIARRRASGERGEDVLSLLLDATDEDGGALSDRHIRDEVMTLLFAGHDTTTSTVAFLFYELARNPDIAVRLAAEQDEVLAHGRTPTAEELMGGALPQLEMAFEETLRKYPPAWIGPRRAVADTEFAGCTIPKGAFVSYSSWASHHLPDVYTDPERFDPTRFTPENKAKLPKGAYIPFGAGTRICIGMRFGQLEIRALASRILSRFTLDLDDDYTLNVRQMPTIGPRNGLPVTVRAR